MVKTAKTAKTAIARARIDGERTQVRRRWPLAAHPRYPVESNRRTTTAFFSPPVTSVGTGPSATPARPSSSSGRG